MKTGKKPGAEKRKQLIERGTLVRIARKDKEVLQQMSVLAGEPMPRILHKALETYRRQKFFDQVNSAFEQLQENSLEWKVQTDEQQLWQASQETDRLDKQ